MAKLCIRCGGTGRYLGNGMMMTDCELCDEDDKDSPEKSFPSLDKINRRSKYYQDAIQDIMAINPDISRKEAIKMFNEAYKKD